jgi:hypothetical protein
MKLEGVVEVDRFRLEASGVGTPEVNMADVSPISPVDPIAIGSGP